ncbi:MAG: sugar ABC transporter permease [Firmicutes bacterium]|nr:sugar ABC transporter permease [Bacillota bacterium]
MAGYLFITPTLLALTIFLFVPLGYVVWLSLTRWNLLQVSPTFVGMQNYAHFLNSPGFDQAIVNTFVLGLGLIVLLLPLGLLLAVLLDMGLRGTRLYRTILFGPYVIPLVASGLAWNLMYNQGFGLIDQILAIFHINGPNWLGSSTWALPAVLFMTVWQYLGYYMLIFLSGLQNVPAALKEAAAVDGANPRQSFWHVTLPAITPSLMFAFVICTIQAFQTFDQVYVMTDGGPDGATSTLVYYIFNQGAQMYNYGIASAASVVLLVLVALFTLLQFALAKRWVVYE